MLFLLSLNGVGRCIAAEYYFEDSFESANMSTSNSFGFQWDSNNRTSIVYHDDNVNKVVWSNGPKDIVVDDGRDWTAFDGNHSLRFRYPVGQNMSEQRFQLGSSLKDFWLSYWIRVPVNFQHGSQNNKFLSIWPKTYDKPGTITWQTRPTSGGANLVYQDGGVTSGEDDPKLFIRYDRDLGRWMNVVVYVKSATSSSANDGIIRLYRRWADENRYTIIHNKENANTWDVTASEQGISQGYFMGWANDPYDTDTEWLIDSIVISDSTLLTIPKSPQQVPN
jgi:hypothetical protein